MNYRGSCCSLMMPLHNYGIGTVISHFVDDTSEQPIVYTLHSLSVTERRYNLIKKEGWAIVNVVKNFTYGRQFKIALDHWLLQHLFINESRAVPRMLLPGYKGGL